MTKLKLNTEWLTGCGGCHVALVDLHDKLLDVLGAVEIQHCPVMTDVKDIPEADIGIVTGAIRNEHDYAAAVAMRKACKKIISFGTCAVYGGLTGAASVHTKEEILDRVYVDSPSTEGGGPPTQRVPPLQHVVRPIDEVIDVDLYLPGCPPHASFIFDALISLVEGREPKSKDENVCGRCTREMKVTEVDTIKSFHEGIPDPDLCFLSQGYICLGSVTLDRCNAPCMSSGVPCTGCCGPTSQVLTEPNRDIRTEVADRMASLTKIKREDTIAYMEKTAKTHYAYAMASKMIGNKPTFLINKWIADVEAQS